MQDAQEQINSELGVPKDSDLVDAEGVESTTDVDAGVAEETSEESFNSTNSGSPKPKGVFSDSVKYHLTGMYQDWFLDYASYVILERAVPDIYDGLKPVQRRILHAMKNMDDGRYTKVANIIGQTMQYHPHGDASIGDALVALGQKDLLIDCQGNWGNILTGDGAAAPRYIEARLTKFALETVFNAKTTHWMLSYDGRNKEPINLPVKFPLLLAQGVEGIAVGLNSKILPHNFNELCDASLAYLRGEPFSLYPDFPTGGEILGTSGINEAYRTGRGKIRVRGITNIETLANGKSQIIITELPYLVNKAKLIEKIAELVKDKKIDGITDLRDESDRDGMRVVVWQLMMEGVSRSRGVRYHGLRLV